MRARAAERRSAAAGRRAAFAAARPGASHCHCQWHCIECTPWASDSAHLNLKCQLTTVDDIDAMNTVTAAHVTGDSESTGIALAHAIAGKPDSEGQ